MAQQQWNTTSRSVFLFINSFCLRISPFFFFSFPTPHILPFLGKCLDSLLRFSYTVYIYRKASAIVNSNVYFPLLFPRFFFFFFLFSFVRFAFVLFFYFYEINKKKERKKDDTDAVWCLSSSPFATAASPIVVVVVVVCFIRTIRRRSLNNSKLAREDAADGNSVLVVFRLHK